MPKVKRKTPIVENFCEAFGSLKDGEPLFVKNSPSKWAVKSYRRLIFSVTFYWEKNSKAILCSRIILLVGEYLRVECSALGKSQREWRKCDFFLTHKSGNLPFLVCVKCDMMSFVVYLNLSRQSNSYHVMEYKTRVKKSQQIWFVKSLTPLFCLVSSPSLVLWPGLIGCWLLGVVHILRNHFWGSRETPPPHVIL